MFSDVCDMLKSTYLRFELAYHPVTSVVGKCIPVFLATSELLLTYTHMYTETRKYTLHTSLKATLTCIPASVIH
jgi:hypothetical protein